MTKDKKVKLSRRDFLRSSAAASAAILAATQGLPIVFAQDAEEQDLPVGAVGTMTIIHRTEYFAELQDLWVEGVNAWGVDNDIDVDLSTANPESFGDFLSKMTAAVAAGNPPDFAYTSNISIAQMHLLDLVEDHTDLIDELIADYGEMMPGPSPAKNAQFDGAWKSVPYLANSGAWFARGEKLAEAGIDPATDLDTYDARRDAALTISDPDGEFWGWGLTPNQSGDGYGFLTALINSYGGSYTDESGLVVTFNSAETLEAVEWLTATYMDEMYAPMLPPGVLSWTDISNNEAFLAGSIGFIANAFSVYAQSKRDEMDYFPEMLVLRPPVGPTGLRTEGPANNWISIFKGAPNVDAAKALTKYLISPEVFTPMAAVGGGLFLPAFENLWTEELLAADKNFGIIMDIVSNPDPYIGASWPAEPSAAIDALRAASVPEQMMANVTSGRMTPAEAVEDAHDRIVDIFEEGGIEQP